MQKAFLETVSFAEGTKQRGYNTWFGNQHYPKDQPDLSKYTINEIVELQKRFLGEGLGRFAEYDSAAVGKYQMTYPETFLQNMQVLILLKISSLQEIRIEWHYMVI